MTNKIAIAFACLGFASAAGAADINFDQGVDIKSAIEQAKNSDIKAPYPYYGPHRVRYSRDCRSFSFGSGMAQSSERAYLSSTEYIEECRFIPAPPPPPPPPQVPGTPPANPGNNPKPGQPGGQPHPKNINDGPHGSYSYQGSYGGQQGTWNCHERTGQVFRATAQMNLPERQLYPWENETFEACMEADRVQLDVRQSPYRYNIDRQGMFDLTFNLTALYRSPTAPDANGLSLAKFFYRDGKFVMDINDAWAREYAGEKVVVKVELMKDGFLFFNSSKGEKEFTLDVNGAYEIAFAENELTKTREYVDDSGDVRGQKKYYVKWGFKRVGSVSTQDYVKKGSTDKIPV